LHTITINYYEVTNGVIRIRKSKDRQHKKKRKEKGHFYKLLYGKLKVEQHESHKKRVWTARLVAPVMLL